MYVLYVIVPKTQKELKSVPGSTTVSLNNKSPKTQKELKSRTNCCRSASPPIELKLKKN